MVEQGVEQKVLQPHEEESRNPLKQGQLRAAERQKENEADWEGATVNGLWAWEVAEGGQRGDRAEGHQKVSQRSTRENL